MAQHEGSGSSGGKSAAGGRRAVPRRARAGHDEPPLHIDSHRAMATSRQQVVEALERRPDLLPLLALNPVQAFADAGVELSPEMAQHVLESIRFSPAAREEREQLLARLRAELGEEPEPTDPEWLARTVFQTLGVAPLDTSGRRPAYAPAIDEQTTARLTGLLASSRRAPTGPAPRGRLTFGARRESDRLLDLDAPVPDLPPAKRPPRRLTLAELWFYRDKHELVPPLLALGVLERSGVQLASPSAYKSIAGGRRPNQLVGWISDVRFAEPPGPPS